MKKQLFKILPLIAYFLSVSVSTHFAAGYWVVGAVFWLAIMAVNVRRLKSALLPRYLQLGAASVLIYAFVFFVADKGWKFENDWADMLLGSMSAGIALGSLLMPAAQAAIFGRDFRGAFRVSLCLIFSWYLVTFIAGLEGALGLGLHINYISVSVALWQGIYLYHLKLPAS